MTGSAATRATAVVLAAHGDRGAGCTNAALRAHAAALDATDRFAAVAAGVLKGEPSLETALSVAEAANAERILIYPFFFADGFFVRTRLSDRIAAAGLTRSATMLPPLGIDPDLPPLIADHVVARAAAAGWTAGECGLLLVGHGSKFGPASAEATRAAAAALAGRQVFADVATAFLEEPPCVAEALRALRAPVVVSGFFAGDGLHAGEDVPDAIAASGIRAVYAGPIGAAPAVSQLILRRLTR